MKAIYKGKLYTMADNLNVAELIDDVDATGSGNAIFIDFADPHLIIDPTDDEINNILPDADDQDFDPHTATQRTIAMLQTEVDYLIARPIDQIVGCNVHGRLTCILALLDAGDLPSVRLELERLLKFFPNPVAKP